MISKYDLKIEENLFNFINLEVIPDIDIDVEDFWKNFSDLVRDLTPINKNLLLKRNEIQNKLNTWHKKNSGQDTSINEYVKFLKQIGYLVDEGGDFNIETNNVDREITKISGPQLVVPITNSRYAINAINARWGSFYDALYGTNVLGDLSKKDEYDYSRGQKVIAYAKNHLDKIAPLETGKWDQINKITVINNEVRFIIDKNTYTNLKNKDQIVGLKYNDQNSIKELVLIKNNLHCRIIIDPSNPIGISDPANISDIILESAISTILDCEDSVATVDSEDKILAYRNWLGLMRGNLETEFIKNKKTVKRKLNKDIELSTLLGEKLFLKSRSLMLIRNVGHLMTNPSILNKNNEEVFEGLMDGVVTSLISMHDLNKKKSNKNSLYSSIYIVKPKMHGPAEISFTVLFFDRIEKMLKLPENTIKIGIMDEERRTSVNLKECIRAAKSRIAFINTGFLDRTGDEIHTSMHAGAFLGKNEMKISKWIKSYEERNVQIGLLCGLQGRAQIGKGMWAMPDLMKEMIDQKISHPKAGANCAWVPSPTAATLHATHYHFVNVSEIQEIIKKKNIIASKEDLLTIPLLDRKNLSDDQINFEIENNIQGILGYIVRWVDQGIGCSKVLDINNVALMEDRATCRISSQALTNWLIHGIVSEKKILNVLKKMALIVDKQNSYDKKYIPMSPEYNSLSFQAASELIFKGLDQPSGYTEPVLHKRRLEMKRNQKNL